MKEFTVTLKGLVFEADTAEEAEQWVRDNIEEFLFRSNLQAEDTTEEE